MHSHRHLTIAALLVCLAPAAHAQEAAGAGLDLPRS